MPTALISSEPTLLCEERGSDLRSEAFGDVDGRLWCLSVGAGIEGIGKTGKAEAEAKAEAEQKEWPCKMGCGYGESGHARYQYWTSLTSVRDG